MNKSNFNLNVFKSYGLTMAMIFSILIGSMIGHFWGNFAVSLKPFGDIFLNLLYTVVVPLVFFSISSAIASAVDIKRLGRIFFWMMIVFIITGVFSSFLMVLGVLIYNPAEGVQLQLSASSFEPVNTADQIVGALTVKDFYELFSKKHILAVIIIAALTGLATASLGERARMFANFLSSANAVMIKLISYIMLYAPIGLCAYFAYLVGVFGPELLGTYVRAMKLYYPLAAIYFFIGFSFYAYLSAGRWGIRRFWTNTLPVTLTALGTGSSMAAMPSNLEAAAKTGVSSDIRNVVIPVGATIHMDGSCLSAILKIALLFGLFGRDFGGGETILIAVGIALLSGTVMSGIPGGGFIGEIMIVTLYGFPAEALPIISMIGTLVDPPATAINAVGDNVASMMVARVVDGKFWMKKEEGPTDL